jgi:thymidine phosphorylase
MALCAEMLVLGELAESNEEALEKLQDVLDNGKAAQVFANMVSALGGPEDFVENYDNYLEKADIVRPVYTQKEGRVISMDTRAIGMAVVAMGGGRRKPTDSIDYAVGLTDFIALGDHADNNKPLAVVHVRNETQFKEAEKALRDAIEIGDGAAESKPMVFEKIRLKDIES